MWKRLGQPEVPAETSPRKTEEPPMTVPLWLKPQIAAG